MPRKIAPALPVLVEELPEGPEWLHELKLDGYRVICFTRVRKAMLCTRRGHDWTARFPSIVGAVEELRLENAILDGEIVALKPDGTSDFQALQHALRLSDDRQIVFFVFDLLYYRGYDLRNVDLIDRKRLLARRLGEAQPSRFIRYNDHIPGHGAEVFSSACRHGLEGIVAKRSNSHYVEGRTTDWVKVSCLRRQEFVIAGWTERPGARESLGALLVGYYRTSTELVYCGRVGTGFTTESLRALHRALKGLEQKRSPFQLPPTGSATRGVIRWAEPRLVAEVAFAAWTAAGMLRHTSFRGVRKDKDPREITLELPKSAHWPREDKPAGQRNSRRERIAPGLPIQITMDRKSPDVFAGVSLTHPDRVLFADEHLTKRDLAAYFTSVASSILPHIVGRPLSLVRCLDGSKKPCFYQKHLGETMPEAVHGIMITEKARKANYIGIDDIQGLISLVQMGVLEIHPWGCQQDRLDRPDRLIFDIDPAEDLKWGDVVHAARRVKERLDDLRLTSFVRTTGGNGLHVVVPIARRTSWESLKTFARTFADALVREHPRHFVAQASKAKRAGKIYLDYLRNEKGATAIASYSARTRRGATVATPISWDELSASLGPERFNTRTVPIRLRNTSQNPWRGFFEIQQAITRSMHTQIRKW
jgi:bifunctional non-homologous end joining protein LigD